MVARHAHAAAPPRNERHQHASGRHACAPSAPTKARQAGHRGHDSKFRNELAPQSRAARAVVRRGPVLREAGERAPARARARGESALSGSAALLRSLRPQLKRALSASLGSGLEPDAVQKNDGAKKSEGGKKASDSTSGGVRAGARAPKQVDGGASSAGAERSWRAVTPQAHGQPASERFAPSRVMTIPCAHTSRRARAPAARAGLGAATFCGLRTVCDRWQLSGESRDGSQEQALRSTRVRRWRARDESQSPADAPPNWCSRTERGRALQFFEREMDGVRARTTRARVFPGVVRLRFGGASESARAVASFPGTPLTSGDSTRQACKAHDEMAVECTEIKLRRILSTTRSDCPSIVRCWRCVTLRHRSALATTPRPALPRRRARTAPQSPRIEASRRGHCAKAQTEARRRVV